ncbi:hypothetical protein [Bacillus glycinifermentans]|uniref:hypothetical protein n=2 Tax=Bacillus glycinifermentans TaxID=1664069 RepID=UPI0022E08906|nr:hypothetical protein [Bacillus glycinifermentans]
MEKITQMNKEIFKENLLKTLKELKQLKQLNYVHSKFLIIPIEEPGKVLDGRDQRMRLWALSEKNIGNRFLEIDEVVNLLGSQTPFVPIWINVSFVEMKEDVAIFKLECSLRFRKPTLLRNAETGHAPFKAIV